MRKALQDELLDEPLSDSNSSCNTPLSSESLISSSTEIPTSINSTSSVSSSRLTPSGVPISNSAFGIAKFFVSLGHRQLSRGEAVPLVSTTLSPLKSSLSGSDSSGDGKRSPSQKRSRPNPGSGPSLSSFFSLSSPDLASTLSLPTKTSSPVKEKRSLAKQKKEVTAIAVLEEKESGKRTRSGRQAGKSTTHEERESIAKPTSSPERNMTLTVEEVKDEAFSWAERAKNCLTNLKVVSGLGLLDYMCHIQPAFDDLQSRLRSLNQRLKDIKFLVFGGTTHAMNLRYISLLRALAKEMRDMTDEEAKKVLEAEKHLSASQLLVEQEPRREEEPKKSLGTSDEKKKDIKERRREDDEEHEEDENDENAEKKPKQRTKVEKLKQKEAKRQKAQQEKEDENEDVPLSALNKKLPLKPSETPTQKSVALLTPESRSSLQTKKTKKMSSASSPSTSASFSPAFSPASSSISSSASPAFSPSSTSSPTSSPSVSKSTPKPTIASSAWRTEFPIPKPELPSSTWDYAAERRRQEELENRKREQRRKVAEARSLKAAQEQERMDEYSRECERELEEQRQKRLKKEDEQEASKKKDMPPPRSPPPPAAPSSRKASRFYADIEGTDETRWHAFVAKFGDHAGGTVQYSDVPWPQDEFKPPGMERSEVNKYFRKMLLRWHPDKFSVYGSGMDSRIMAGVTAVAQKIIPRWNVFSSR